MGLSECVCLSDRISSEPQERSLPYCLCMLPVSVPRSSSDMFTIGRIAYHREGFFFPTENALSAGERGMGVHSAGEVCYERLPCSDTGTMIWLTVSHSKNDVVYNNTSNSASTE